MLQILKANRESTEQIFIEKLEKGKEPKQRPPKHDITVNIITEKEEYNKDGSKTIRKEKEIYNITRQINETAKIVKAQDALQKLEELKKIIK